MEEEFIPYEQALVLKELGFDEPCFGYFDPLLGDYTIMNSDCINPKPTLFNHNSSSIVVSAPTFSQAFRWFREEYKTYIQHDAVLTGHSQGHRFILKDSAYLSIVGTTWCKTYKEAELECLKKLIEIVKENNLIRLGYE